MDYTLFVPQKVAAGHAHGPEFKHSFVLLSCWIKQLDEQHILIYLHLSIGFIVLTLAIACVDWISIFQPVCSDIYRWIAQLSGIWYI